MNRYDSNTLDMCLKFYCNFSPDEVKILFALSRMAQGFFQGNIEHLADYLGGKEKVDLVSLKSRIEELQNRGWLKFKNEDNGSFLLSFSNSFIDKLTFYDVTNEGIERRKERK